MASPACHKLPALSRITPVDRPPIQHPHLHSLLPLLPHPDPLCCTNFFIFPSPPSPSNAPFVRNFFEDAVCDSMCPDFLGTLPNFSAHVCPAASTKLQSTDNSTNSSSSSSDFCISSNSENDEDDTDSSSSSSLSRFESSSLGEVPAQEGPLDSLASLCAALPIKRGLSRYFSGKSQSFSSLARVSSVAELAKPENPYVKRRRTAGVGVDAILKHHSYPPRCSSSAGISKRPATCNRSKSLKVVPCPQGVSLEGLAKCFSVPEF